MIDFEKVLSDYIKLDEDLDDLFGDEHPGRIRRLIYDLVDYGRWAHAIIEEAKTAGTYDAVMHARTLEELEDCKRENKRLHNLAMVGVGVEYLNGVTRISLDASPLFYNTQRQAESQLRDRVLAFLKTFEE